MAIMKNYLRKVGSHLFIPMSHPKIESVPAAKQGRTTNSLQMKTINNGKTMGKHGLCVSPVVLDSDQGEKRMNDTKH